MCSSTTVLETLLSATAFGGYLLTTALCQQCIVLIDNDAVMPTDAAVAQCAVSKMLCADVIDMLHQWTGVSKKVDRTTLQTMLRQHTEF
jgi:hypothetical protein